MWGPLYRAMSLDPKRRNFSNARYILSMLTPRGPVSTDGMVEFDCRYFDRGTRRCTAYDRRPKMCRDFPNTGVCQFCGARFESNANRRAADDDLSASERGRRQVLQWLMHDAHGSTAGKTRPRR
jgi:Fe-S-cluster containining protein